MKPCALGLIFTPDRKNILLIKRSDLPIWVIPGGGIDEGEEPLNAAAREVFEEAGIHVQLNRLASVYEPKNNLSSKTYIFEGFSQDSPIAGPEAKLACYFPIQKLPKDLFVLHQIWIDRILNAPTVIHTGLITEITFQRVMNFFIRRPHVLLMYIWNRLFKKW
jgi:8-oxo-dGTP pyrophosphatase MutT (NUDIX family)